MTTNAASDADRAEPVFRVNASRGFTDWLREHDASLAVTTYQVGKLLFFGAKADGSLWVFNRNIGRCLGLAVDHDDLWVTADTQILKLTNMLGPGQRSDSGCDALYVPRLAHFTGDLDAHDLAVTGDGRAIFVNTLFNCLAAVSTTHNFVPLWRPPFISRLVAEDRCHLNGLALRDGQPAYLTAVSTTDTFDGWRDHRQGGGVVIDVASNEIVAEGLSMPHAPRWHRGRLWLHNSGTGEFGALDPTSGRFEPVCFAPGYLRGLDFVGNFAVMGLSRPRDNRTFTGLALDDALRQRRIEPRCGIQVADLSTGAIVHSLTFDGVITELYDVAILSGKTQPSALGPASPDLKRMIAIGHE
jgi:uncharacterized protein (TIGR03032 family)